MPPRGDTDVEWQVLTTDLGRILLDQVMAVARAGPSDVARWRKTHPPEWVVAAQRLVQGRRKGLGKFERAAQMWFDPVGAEQSTGEVVARHKSRRFGEGGLVVDLCSGIGGDTIALAGANEVIAVDLDRGMGRRGLWNARVHERVDRVLAVQSRAEAFPIPDGARVHVDPDRRSSGPSKVKAIDEYAPRVSTLQRLARTARGGAIKLGPSSDFETHFGDDEVELISLDGECKEATIWFGDLASTEVRRRATCLPSGASWTDRDALGWSRKPISTPKRFVFDPDPSLTRSGLLDGFAWANGLSRLAEGVDLLTGSAWVESPFLSGFEVVAVFPLDLKILRREVLSRGLGRLEIKTRGLEVRPEAYRVALKAIGPNPATWILLGRRDEPGLAILAHRPSELITRG